MNITNIRPSMQRQRPLRNYPLFANHLNDTAGGCLAIGITASMAAVRAAANGSHAAVSARSRVPLVTWPKPSFSAPLPRGALHNVLYGWGKATRGKAGRGPTAKNNEPQGAALG